MLLIQWFKNGYRILVTSKYSSDMIKSKFKGRLDINLERICQGD